MSLSMHPLAELFPPMSDVEFANLTADIKENGLREPIIVHEGQVLDGRNRYRACMEIGIEPMTRTWDGKGDPLDFVVSKNLHRRHLDEGQRAMVSAKIANLRREDTLMKGPDRPIGLSGISQAQAAKMMNVGERSVRRARVVIDKGVPELQAAVEAGAVSVRAAAAVAYKPQEEQREIVSQGPAAITKAAKVAKAAQSNGSKLTVVPAAVIPTKPLGGGTISVPEGTTIEEQVRKGLALEAAGTPQADAIKEIGIGKESFRYVRDLIVMLDEISLDTIDRETVSTALATINETKQISAYEAARPIVQSVWGTQPTPHTSKAARKRLDHFATVVGIAVQSCANFSLKEFEIPYLSESDRRRWIGEAEQARRELDAFLRKLKD